MGAPAGTQHPPKQPWGNRLHAGPAWAKLCCSTRCRWDTDAQPGCTPSPGKGSVSRLGIWG